MRPEGRDPGTVDAAMADLGRALDGLEHFIAPTGWAASEGRALADCALVPQLLILDRLLPAFGRTDPLAVLRWWVRPHFVWGALALPSHPTSACAESERATHRRQVRGRRTPYRHQHLRHAESLA